MCTAPAFHTPNSSNQHNAQRRLQSIHTTRLYLYPPILHALGLNPSPEAHRYPRASWTAPAICARAAAPRIQPTRHTAPSATPRARATERSFACVSWRAQGEWAEVCSEYPLREEKSIKAISKHKFACRYFGRNNFPFYQKRSSIQFRGKYLPGGSFTKYSNCRK